eukprot:jgi/Mesvir1/14573/Mv05252-RA.1
MATSTLCVLRVPNALVSGKAHGCGKKGHLISSASRPGQVPIGKSSTVPCRNNKAAFPAQRGVVAMADSNGMFDYDPADYDRPAFDVPEKKKTGPFRFLAGAAAAAAAGYAGYSVIQKAKEAKKLQEEAGVAHAPANASTPGVKPSAVAGGTATYKVQPGDTLAKIASKFGTTQAVILEANMIDNPDYIGVGQVLWVPNTYTIQKGDYLNKIAKKFGVSVDALVKANQITNPDLIYEGDVLLLPMGAKLQ